MSSPDTEDRKSSEASFGVAPGSPAQASTRQTTFLHILLLLLIAILATRAMWGPALLGGHSAWIDLIRLIEFDDAVRHGSFLPTWSPDLYSGYGSPLFQFYAPLCYYLSEIPVLLGCDFPTALKVTQLVALWASGLALYRLAVTYFSGWAACLGGVLYMVAPYRLVDIYVRHALAEHCGFIWLPLIVWGTERFVSQRSRAGLITGVLATAALILTHNIMALIGLPVCVTAGWIFSLPTGGGIGARAPCHFRQHLIAFFSAGIPAVLGVGLATFFWWPAMTGRPLVQAEQSLTGGYYDFHHHFVAPFRFFALDWSFGSSGPDAKEKMSMQIGLPHLLAALGALVLLIQAWRGAKEDRTRVRWASIGLLTLLGAVFACSEASHRLWETLPLIKYAQFPWRFLSLAVFGATLCGTALADRLGAASPRAERIVFLAGLVLVLAAYAPYYSHAHFLAGDARTRTVLPMTSAKVDTLDAAGLLVPIGRGITPADIRKTGDRATSSDDFLPRDVQQQKPAPSPGELLTSTDGAIGPVTQPRFNDYHAEVQMKSPGTVQLRQFWFPGWQATIDGQPVATTPAGPQAVVSCTVPAGPHTIEFRYHALPQRRTGFIVSFLALVLTLAGIFAIRIGRQSPIANGPI